jgi:Zn ribbon nucleic-acid-binding protein
MTFVHLICPQCRNQDEYDERNLDASKEIACSSCGFSELPTEFELAKDHESKSWQFVKFTIIGLALIAFIFFGLSTIALGAFFVPIIVAAVIVILAYRRCKEKVL